MAEENEWITPLSSVNLRELAFQATVAGEYSLLAIHYLGEQNGFKSAFSTMYKSKSFPDPRNALFMM